MQIIMNNTKSRVWYRVKVKAPGPERLPVCRLKDLLSINHPFLTQMILHILQIGRGEGEIITSLAIIPISIMGTPDSLSAITRMGVICALEGFMRALTSVQVAGCRLRIIPRVEDTYQSAGGEGP